MKASNTLVMIQAYRLLVNRMDVEGMNYPLHLGVTEAGEGEDGRIKSAVGIGTLLADGLGDTIRVSLTEAPEFEMPVAKNLLSHFNKIESHEEIKEITKFLQQPESELKIEMGEPDEIASDEKGSKFYIYKKKKYGITCEKKFEIDENNMVVGVSSRGCF